MKKFAVVIILCLMILAACEEAPTPAPVQTPEFESPPADPSLQAFRPSPTPTPAASPIPARPTVTAAPSPAPPTVIQTPTPWPGHDITRWHPPRFGHHHGANPYESPYGDFYLEQTGQEIAYFWTSSPLENCDDAPGCKHAGFVFLAEHGLGCPQLDRAGEYNCINGYLLLVHSMGTVHEMHTRIHSNYGVFEVCSRDGSQCGLVATGGHADYGVFHNGYKEEVCELPADPDDYPYGTGPGLNRLPYRAAVNTTLLPPTNMSVNPQFWNSQGPGPGHDQYYPHLPNNILGVSWSGVDGWEMPDGMDCGNPEAAVAFCPDGSCELNHTAFQVFAIRLQNLPEERPFTGFTDVNGHVAPNCAEPSAVCVPLVIEAGVPAGEALLARGVRHGKCDQVPCQEFDNGALLLMPGFESAGHH